MLSCVYFCLFFVNLRVKICLWRLGFCEFSEFFMFLLLLEENLLVLGNDCGEILLALFGLVVLSTTPCPRIQFRYM